MRISFGQRKAIQCKGAWGGLGGDRLSGTGDFLPEEIMGRKRLFSDCTPSRGLFNEYLWLGFGRSLLQGVDCGQK